MKIYRFNIRMTFTGPVSVVYNEITISSTGETEEEAYNKLKESLTISNIHKINSIQIK